jgi:hypothetical protein
MVHALIEVITPIQAHDGGSTSGLFAWYVG